MRYRSILDMKSVIEQNLGVIPPDVDLVVGIPRSGLLPALIISLFLNIRYTDLDAFLSGKLTGVGATKQHRGLIVRPDEARHVLVVDDSLNRGYAMRKAREQVSQIDGDVKFSFAAIYVVPDGRDEVDIIFEVLPLPRIFEWNFMHHSVLKHACVDIDGVLCRDPTQNENDDGAGYARFLADVRPFYRPTHRIGCIVTSRLEKYRPQTEDWLSQNGIHYDELIMLDLPTAQERRRLAAHGNFKGRVYRNSNAVLFIESEHSQAIEIARISGKPVLSIERHEIVDPGASPAAAIQKMRNFSVNARMSNSPIVDKEALKRRLRKVLPRRIYEVARNMYAILISVIPTGKS